MNTIFLDRDGVINENYGYVHNWKNFDIIAGSLKALQLLTKNNFQIIIVTNQSGIAKGIYTEVNFHILMNEFNKFCLNNNIEILDVIYCPHHENAIIKKYKKKCQNRKPSPGMFFQASRKYKINLKNSIMVGDNVSDIIAANRAGIKMKYLIDPLLKIKITDTKLCFKTKPNLLNVVEEIINYSYT
jgi:D-glycero-D-manno-heptose 1,7-bisphosphate phosphatase